MKRRVCEVECREAGGIVLVVLACALPREKEKVKEGGGQTVGLVRGIVPLL